MFIIRLFPEITIKSTSIRKRWSKKLVDNLRILSRRIYPKTTVILDWDRIILRLKPSDMPEYQQDECLHAISAMLASTPGIAYFSRVHSYEFDTMEGICESVFKHWQGRLDNKTFSVRVKRSGKHDFTSNDLERYVGGELHKHTPNAGVKLKDPDETVRIEVKGDTCYIVEERRSGLGGFPIGTQDDVLSLVSGGFDSSVASYLMMRRGLKTHYCFFSLGGREHEIAVKELAFFLWNRFGSSHRVRFTTIPFEPIVHEILTKVGPANMGVVLKRMMLRVADKLIQEGGYGAMVTGEAISQVSSQTLTNLKLIDEVSESLVLRPLITMDKPAIINMARQIDVETFCANIPEYCGVISVKPAASVKKSVLELEEAELDLSLIDQAIKSSQCKAIDEVMDDCGYSQAEQCDVVSEPSRNDVIIDVRHPYESEVKALHVEGVNVKSIPFYSLASEWAQLDVNTRHLLYCDKGVMSKLHATHLLEEGYNNVGVYRP